MKVAVMGAGAIGTWLGAALAEAGEDVTLIARGAHLAALQREGARLAAPEGDRVVALRAVGDPAQAGEADVIVLAVKAHDLPVAGPALAPLLGPQTVLVAAQNGVPYWYFHGRPGPEVGRRVAAVDPGGAVSAALPPDRVIGSVVYLGASLLAPGVVAVRPEAGLVLGEPDGSASARLERVASAFERAGFPVRRTADIRTEMWTKLMGNASFNLVSVVTGAGLGTMATDPGTGPLIMRVMTEVVEIADALGARPQISIPERVAIAGRLGEHKTSTLQDLEAGKRLELGALGGAVVELADLVGVAAPTLRAVFALAALRAHTLGLS